ncbi:MAG: hypothetical protein FWH40_08715 [Coriobacteriia bacterium]|nr:hypothetical protein [Coriobacteriia bacterium]
MKKLLLIALSLSLVLAVSACKKNPQDDTDKDEPGISGTKDPDQNGGGENEGSKPSDPPYDIQAVIASLPDEEALNEVWGFIKGYWTASEDRYVGFIEEAGVKYIQFGVFDSVNYGYGELVDFAATGDTQISFQVHYPAMPATENANAHPELEVTISIDLGDLIQNGKLSAVVDTNGPDWVVYSFGGESLDEARHSAR